MRMFTSAVCMAVSGDLQTGELEVAEEAVYPSVDRGFDFYAPQTFEDETGRRILIGWMGIPDAPYENPTAERGLAARPDASQRTSSERRQIDPDPLGGIEETS